MNQRVFIYSVATLALAASAWFVVPKAWQAAQAFRNEEASIRYQVSRIPAVSYVAKIDQALREEDTDLARSVVALADAQGIALPPEVLERIDVTEENAPAFWEDEALAISILDGVSDFFVIGDARDLYRQYNLYPAYDPLIVGLAAGGIAITGATWMSGGAALPARIGLTTLKTAQKAGRISTGLVADLGMLVRRSINMKAVGDVARNVIPPRPAAIREASGRMFSKQALNNLAQIGTNVYQIGDRHGRRAIVQTLRVADNAVDLHRFARVANLVPEKAYRGVLALVPSVGSALLWVGTVGLIAATWLATAMAWLLAAAFIGFKILRLAYRTLRMTLRIGRWAVRP